MYLIDIVTFDLCDKSEKTFAKAVTTLLAQPLVELARRLPGGLIIINIIMIINMIMIMIM